MKLQRIAVTTDYSEAARKAYPVATELANQHGARLYLVHVAEALPPLAYLNAEGVELDPPNTELLRDAQKHLDEELVESQLIADPKLLYHADKCQALKNFVIDESIDLVVTATHGLSGVLHALLGSFAEKVVRTCPCPVLTCSSNADDPSFKPTTVLVPTDLSENSLAVLPVLRQLSETTPANFVFCYVVEPMPILSSLGSGTVATSLREEHERAPAEAKAAFEKLRERAFPELETKFEILSGRPHVELVDRAKTLGADLILMGTHGRTGWKHIAIGSVAERVVRQAPCPVWTVRAEVQSSEAEKDESRSAKAAIH